MLKQHKTLAGVRISNQTKRNITFLEIIKGEEKQYKSNIFQNH